VTGYCERDGDGRRHCHNPGHEEDRSAGSPSRLNSTSGRSRSAGAYVRTERDAGSPQGTSRFVPKIGRLRCLRRAPNAGSARPECPRSSTG
jgi:hypothetical protein